MSETEPRETSVRLADIAPRLALARDQWVLSAEHGRRRMRGWGSGVGEFARLMGVYAEHVRRTGVTMAAALGRIGELPPSPEGGCVGTGHRSAEGRV